MLGWLIAGFVSFSSFASAQEVKMRFPYSAETAREVDKSVGSGYEFYKEVGVATGPFVKIGYVEVNASGLHRIMTFSDSRQWGSVGGIDDPNVDFLVHFFVNPKGGSFVVVHKRPVLDPVPIARDDQLDPRTGEHVYLSGAVKMAIWDDNVPLLKMLLETGFEIDEPIEWDGLRWTALHQAALSNQPEIVRFLLDEGADREVRDKYGELPITRVVGNLGNKKKDQAKVVQICEMLRKPISDKAEEMISGYPRNLLFETFFADRDVVDQQVRFLSLNDQDPDPKLLEMAREVWPKVRPRSRMEIATQKNRIEEKGESAYRDHATREYGVVVELILRPRSDEASIFDEPKPEDASVFEWSRRVASGKYLSGGGVRGIVEKKYGYWISQSTESWDE